MKQTVSTTLTASALLCQLLFSILLNSTPGLAQQLALRDLGAAPEFSLLNSYDQTFSSTELKGKVWVANFFFSRCQGPCPIQAAHLQKLSEDFDSSQAQFVSITADPEHDTPAVLRKYAETLSADSSQWHFLSGNIEHILALMNDGFSLGSGDEPINHSSRFVLVDAEGKIRGYYAGTDTEQIKQLAAAIRLLNASPQ